MIIRRNKRNIINILILLFAIFPIFPNSIKGLPVILLFVASLFFFDKRSINWRGLLLNSSLFLIYLISLIQAQDYSLSLRKLETSLSILVIPLTFFVLLNSFNFSIKIKEIFIKTFIISSSLFSLCSIVFICITEPVKYYLWRTDKYRNIITEMPFLGQHPIYASIFLSLAVFFFFYLLKKQYFKAIIGRVLFIILTLINLLVIIILSSKAVIITIFSILFFFFVQAQKKRLNVFVTIITFLFIAIALFAYNHRMGELVSPDTYQKFNPELSTSIRMEIYGCSYGIIKSRPIIGYGVGGAQRQLSLCYASKSNMLLFNKFNTHNQYLDITIKTGLIGLLVFGIFLASSLASSIRNKNQLLTVIVIFYSMLFLTENILSRQSGVILFFFLICFFKNANFDSQNNDL